MITATTDLKNVLYQAHSVNITAGATIEYNMNMMLDNITISTNVNDNNYVNMEEVKVNPFKKLFPLDSVLKPFRPTTSGIKYYLNSDTDHLGGNRFYDFRQLPYPQNAPRVYYPGVTTYYKYWLTPVNTAAQVTVKYIHDTAVSTQAYATGSKMIYTTSTDHGFKVGQRVTISGSGDATFDITNQVISSVPDAKTFAISSSLSARPISQFTKTVTLVDGNNVAKPTKPALSNKIVVRFEKYHALPFTCTIVISHKDLTSQSVTAVIPSSGIVTLYHNGTSWTETPTFTANEPIVYYTPKEVKSIAVNIPAAGAGKMVGVIEISARWVKDITQDLVSFNISKESTSNPEDILPVGNITANSLDMSLVNYSQTSLKVLAYNRDDDWVLSPDIFIYFVKNAEIKPYFKVYHSAGLITQGSNKYDNIWQGSYFIDSFSISQYGDAQVNALDGSKQLMETLTPDIIYKQSPVTAIIMGILDSIGFSNYQINMLLDVDGKSIDTSIPTLGIWWSENNKTVWQCLQELCRDIQMNAFFDENNVLQFYTRDYLYSKSNVDWEFYHSQSGNKLPNIIEFNKQELNSANQVKILWKTPMSGQYVQNSTKLWSAPESFLIAGGLRYEILADTPAELINFSIDIDNLDPSVPITSTFGYSGYFLVDSEIFEYDAIEYEYVLSEGSISAPKKNAFISSEGEWAKYRALSKTGSQFFKPTGKYRIKERGVFGTEKARHEATSTIAAGWLLKPKDTWL